MRISVIKFEEQNPWKLGACAFWAWASRLHYLLSLDAMVGWMGWSIYNMNINSLGYAGKQRSESKTGSFKDK